MCETCRDLVQNILSKRGFFKVIILLKKTKSTVVTSETLYITANIPSPTVKYGGGGIMMLGCFTYPYLKVLLPAPYKVVITLSVAGEASQIRPGRESSPHLDVANVFQGEDDRLQKAVETEQGVLE